MNIQNQANPYITILGPIESGAKRIAIMGIANKTAGALGSLIFGAILLSGIDELYLNHFACQRPKAVCIAPWTKILKKQL